MALLASCSTQRPVYRVIESGEEAAERGNYELAEVEFSEALSRSPDEWEARLELAKVYLETDRPDLALEQLDIVATVSSDEPELRDLRARALVESGQVDRAAEELSRAAEESGDVGDWMRYGRAMEHAGDADQARQAYMQAATVSGGADIGPHLALASLYRDIGDEESALERYRMALWIDPVNDTARSAIREMGHVPGPSFALRPAEMPADGG